MKLHRLCRNEVFAELRQKPELDIASSRKCHLPTKLSKIIFDVAESLVVFR